MTLRLRYRPLFGVTLVAMLILRTMLAVDAQTVVNGTTVYIPDGLEVHVDGDVGNTGFLQNLGIFYLTGDWRNINVYQGAGTIVLQGDRAQNIFNNKNAVNRLVIDGTGRKSVEDKLPVTTQFDLLSGIVVTEQDDTLFLASSATVTGGSSLSFVDGPLFSEGVGYKYFPIGKNGNYHPVEMTDITGINPVFSLEVFQNLPAISAPADVTLYQDAYWKRADVSGVFTASPVVLGYDVRDNRTDTHLIHILQANNLDDTFTSLGKVTVEFSGALDKVISEELDLTGKIFVLGESVPIGGVEGAFYLSNSLSPDAANDNNRAVRIFGNQLEAEDFRFLVYNRWGLVVFESESLQDMIVKGWDGRNKTGGDLLPSGAYPYVLKARMKSGKKLEKKGIVTIVN
jgi:hypothetical protein